LDRFLSETAVELATISMIVVALGPGSFTGLRSGIAFCQGLCASGRRKLVGISSLALLRAQFKHEVHGRVGVITRARPGFWYVGLDAEGWPSAAFGAKLPEEEFLSDDEAAKFLKGAAVILSDQERPISGLLAALEGHWHIIPDAPCFAVASPLFPLIPAAMNWGANYLQPSYAEQAR